jgi:hypothetical protein
MNDENESHEKLPLNVRATGERQAHAHGLGLPAAFNTFLSCMLSLDKTPE